MNELSKNPDGYKIERDIRENLRCEAYMELQRYLLNLQENKDLRPGEVVHLLLDSAKAWTQK